MECFEFWRNQGTVNILIHVIIKRFKVGFRENNDFIYNDSDRLKHLYQLICMNIRYNRN